MNPSQMQLAEIKIETDGGPWCTHNMPCPIFRDKHAVLNMNTGVFHPSWHAQESGWKLVKADTRVGKWILRRFFEETK
jgi:hypothetical protein